MPGVPDSAGKEARTRPVARSCAFTLPAKPAAPWLARGCIRHWLEQLQVPAEDLDDIEFVVSEAVSNSAEHAYPPDLTDGTVDVTAELLIGSTGSRRVQVEIRDHGRWQPVSPDRGLRGFGLSAMAAMADEMTIRRGDAHDRGTAVTVARDIPARPPMHPVP